LFLRSLIQGIFEVRAVNRVNVSFTTFIGMNV